ncbi:MAG: alkaline phosphatase D family protein [Betaproteobacteria bacterium]|nr:alkaline phosphatase D family protein [Betaproteobacteria bacterium]
MSLSRRRFLVDAAGLAASALLPIPRALARPRFASDPFTLGVASGYPQPAGFVLWTRLAPRPLEGGGMPPQTVEIGWELAADESFGSIVRKGKAVATPELAHSVHVELTGLEPARWYWYRFHAGGAASPIGRTRTAPAPDAAAERMRFAFASCQQYEQGYYAAYRHMSREDLDLVIHLGDYIYESSWGRNHVRKHEAGEPITLREYRNRHALYKSDPDLQAAHASFPWLVTWDDHEVDNDYAGDHSEERTPPELFLRRRAAAYQAYYEHMPLPGWARPRGPHMQLYARAAFGGIARFHILDGRQYKSPQVCTRPGRGGSNVVEDCAERLDPHRTLLGAAQEKWLLDGLSASRARWNIIAQQTLMAQADRMPGAGQSFWTDGWDGYPEARKRILSHIADGRIANPVVIGGDVHMSVVADLRIDFDDPRAPVVATEFVGTSISSQGRPRREVEAWAPDNPHIKHANPTRRGYTAMELSARRCLAQLRTLDDVRDPQSPIRTLVAYAVEDGRPGAERS